MSLLPTIIEAVILMLFKLQKDGELQGAADKVVDMLYDGAHLMHSAVKILTGQLDPAETQQAFDEAQQRFRDKYRRD